LKKVNNQLKNIKKNRSLARRKNIFEKKKLDLNRVLQGRSGHESTQQVNQVLPGFFIPVFYLTWIGLATGSISAWGNLLGQSAFNNYAYKLIFQVN
jgi:hypothetical protein